MADTNLSLQIIPRVEDERIYPVVDEVIAMIAATGLPYSVGPMETTIEGNLEVLLDIVKKAHQICIEANARRVFSVIKIDFRPDGVSIDEKIHKYR
ncbi:MAG: thiamine-binding protein [Syntrophomonadaceae bacterium]|jgi:uncharacterized protein YqgV (UPF0045/DUF77 family)